MIVSFNEVRETAQILWQQMESEAEVSHEVSEKVNV